jgi:hypothetical protein
MALLPPRWLTSAALVLAVCLVVVLGPGGANAQTCTYRRNANTVTCGSVTCATLANVGGGGKLPTGTFRIGALGMHSSVPWMNLYPTRRSGGFWDYHSLSPDHGCRGGFAFHPGSVSLGCITVTDNNCWLRIERVVRAWSVSSLSVRECRTCRGVGVAGFGLFGCLLGEQDTTARVIGTLSVTD